MREHNTLKYLGIGPSDNAAFQTLRLWTFSSLQEDSDRFPHCLGSMSVCEQDHHWPKGGNWGTHAIEAFDMSHTKHQCF